MKKLIFILLFISGCSKDNRIEKYYIHTDVHRYPTDDYVIDKDSCIRFQPIYSNEDCLKICGKYSIEKLDCIVEKY